MVSAVHLIFCSTIQCTSLECLELAGEVIPEKTTGIEDQTSNFRKVWKTKAVHLLSVFILIYVGVEVTIGGLLIVKLNRVGC